MSEFPIFSGADKEKLECALGLMTELVERFADTKVLAEEVAQYDLNDELWLMSQILSLPADQRELMVQAFLCAEGRMTVTSLKGGLLLASEPDWTDHSRVIPIDAVARHHR